MAPKRLITAATLLGFGLNLASCGSFVADHWPHWAGGMPADAPPRPGAPGYEEFIAHGQSKPHTKPDTKPDAKPDPKQEPTATAAAVQSGAPQAPLPPASAASVPPAAGAAAPANDLLQDSSVVNGGLY